MIGARPGGGGRSLTREGARARGPAGEPDSPSKKKPAVEQLKAVWPDLKALILPRRRLLGWGFALMAVNRVSGLVLPASTKFLVDDVIGKRRMGLLLPVLGAVIAATLVQ